MPDDEYKKQAEPIARSRLMYGGARLAELMTEIFSKTVEDDHCPRNKCGIHGSPPNDCIGAPPAYCTMFCFNGCEKCCATDSIFL